MKNKINNKLGIATLVLVFIMSLITLEVSANEKALLADYWVIENNVNDKSFTTVRFYNYQDKVVMEKTLEGKFIKLNKRDIKRLNKELKEFNSKLKSEG